jgi:hypothetical protein
MLRNVPDREKRIKLACVCLLAAVVKTLIHRMRKRYTVLVREEITRTISDSGDEDAEIRELCEALIAAEGWIMP